MKKEYPDYRKGTSIKEIFESLNQKDQEILNDFLNYCRVTSSEKKIDFIKRIMIQIYDVTETSYNDFDQKTLIGFLKILNQSNRLPSTRNDIKKVLKRFLRWKYKDWANRFDDFRIIKLEYDVNHERLNDKVLLKPEEIEKLLRGAETLAKKALLMLLFESAARPGEIVKLRWNDIDFNKGIVYLFCSKTKRFRPIPIKESLIHLKRYKQEFPHINVKSNDYLFPSPLNRDKHLTPQAINDYIRKLGKNVIGRHIFPYLFRHTRLSPLIQILSPKVYESFAGHSIATGKKYYGHLSKDAIHQEILEKVYHIEEISQHENKKVEELESRIIQLEGTIHTIVSKANLVFDIKGL